MTHTISGFNKDLPDRRDYKFVQYRLSDGNLPTKVDLRDKCSPVKNQADLGACTAFALCSLGEFLEIKNGKDFVPLSELFLYYYERLAEGTVLIDNGATLRTGIKTLVKKGVCRSDLWEYIPAKFRRLPRKAARLDALNHQVEQYLRLQTLIDFKQCLADGFPFVCGIAVYDSFMSSDNGIIPYPTKDDTLQGWHAIAVYGYDNEKEVFICKNSWGLEWGDNGFFYLPYKYLTNTNLTADIWTIRVQEGC